MMINLENISYNYKRYNSSASQEKFMGIIPKKENVHALCNINMEIKAGERVAILGANGSGKTTLIKIMSGIIRPSEGNVMVMGHDPSKRDKEYLNRVALYAPNKSLMWWEIGASRSYKLFKAAYGIPDDKYKRRVEEYTKYLSVDKLLDVPMRCLSLGQRVKFEIIAALLHCPTVLLFDEPCIGLDIESQYKIHKLLVGYVERCGAALILTSHNMNDIMSVCTRFYLLRSGTIIGAGDIGEVEKYLPNRGMQCQVSKTYISA